MTLETSVLQAFLSRPTVVPTVAPSMYSFPLRDQGLEWGHDSDKRSRDTNRPIGRRTVGYPGQSASVKRPETARRIPTYLPSFDRIRSNLTCHFSNEKKSPERIMIGREFRSLRAS